MVRPLLTILVFAALLFAGDRLGALMLGNVAAHSAIPVYRLYAGRAPAEVVVLGNSRAYRHLLADEIGGEFALPSESFAYPGLGMRASLALLQDFIDRYGDPKLVIVELTGLASDGAFLADFRPLVGYSPRLASQVRERLPRLYYAGQVSHLVNYNGNGFPNALHKVIAPIGDLRLSGHLGKSEVEAWSALPAKKNLYFRNEPAEVAALKRILAIGSEHGFEVRLIVTPVHPTFARRVHYDLWRDEVQGLLAPHKVWDYGDTEEIPLRGYADGTHLNAAGVDQFVCMLRQDGFFQPGAEPPSDDGNHAACGQASASG